MTQVMAKSVAFAVAMLGALGWATSLQAQQTDIGTWVLEAERGKPHQTVMTIALCCQSGETGRRVTFSADTAQTQTFESARLDGTITAKVFVGLDASSATMKMTRVNANTTFTVIGANQDSVGTSTSTLSTNAKKMTVVRTGTNGDSRIWVRM